MNAVVLANMFIAESNCSGRCRRKDAYGFYDFVVLPVSLFYYEQRDED
jgi:hypothetical protein